MKIDNTMVQDIQIHVNIQFCKADIRDGNEYKIRKWLVLKFHGSGHLPNHTTSK
jgi:hypothetical protein